jgi:hypothetical protein
MFISGSHLIRIAYIGIQKHVDKIDSVICVIAQHAIGLIPCNSRDIH